MTCKALRVTDRDIEIGLDNLNNDAAVDKKALYEFLRSFALSLGQRQSLDRYSLAYWYR